MRLIKIGSPKTLFKRFYKGAVVITIAIVIAFFISTSDKTISKAEASTCSTVTNCINEVGNTGSCGTTQFFTDGSSCALQGPDANNLYWCGCVFPPASPTPTPCFGVSACFIGSCTFWPGACGVSSCVNNGSCLAATPTPIPPTPTSAPSCPGGYTLCSDNTCYSCPADYTVNCSTNPVSCTFTGTAPTPTPTIAPGGNCQFFGCANPSSITRTWSQPSGFVSATGLSGKSGTCSSAGNSCSMGLNTFTGGEPVGYTVYVGGSSAVLTSGSTTAGGPCFCSSNGTASFSWTMIYQFVYCEVPNSTTTTCTNNPTTVITPTFFTTADISNPKPFQWYRWDVWAPIVSGDSSQGTRLTGGNVNAGACICPATPTLTPTPTIIKLPTSTPIPTPVPTYTISGTVYIDNNGNGAPDAGEPAYNGATVTRTGSVSTTTNLGSYSFSSLTAGGYTITLTVPAGYVKTTTNPVSTSVGPDTTVNFGIAPARTISGNVFIDDGAGGGIANNGVKEIGEANYTASAITITSTISSSPIGTVSYPTPPNPSGQFIVSGVYAKLLPYSIRLTAIPAGYVISNAGAIPNTNPRDVMVTTADVPNINFGIAPTYTISGNVFIDDGAGTACPGPTCGAKDGIKNGTEGNYTAGAITITSSPTGTVTYPTPPNPSGQFTVSNLIAGTYTISYTNLPSGYQIINPTTGPPPFFSVGVGPSVPNVNFAILLYGPWIQSTGTDIRFDNGFNYYIPPLASCGPYASGNGGGVSNGIIFTGSTNANFGAGSAGQTTNWVVGGSGYPELFIPSKGNVIRTSYNYMNAQIKQAGLTPTTLATTQCGALGTASCVLSATLSNGLYIANGLTLSGGGASSYTFPINKNYVILVNGDLTINTNILVPKTSTVTFIVSGDIIVAPTVGETLSTSALPDIEGFYSTDGNFKTGGGSLRLNIAGSVIVNAAKTSPAGTFQLQRDLGAGNANCPAFSIQERPDFILNAPDLIKYQNTIYREVAP